MLFFKQKPVYILCGVALIFIIASAVGLIHYGGTGAQTIVLHFDAVRGADQFGAVSNLWELLGIMVLMMGINIFLAQQFFYKERLISYGLLGASAFFSFLFFIALMVILSVN